MFCLSFGPWWFLYKETAANFISKKTKSDKTTINGYYPALVEVGSLSNFFYRVLYIPSVVGNGISFHQQYDQSFHVLNRRENTIRLSLLLLEMAVVLNWTLIYLVCPKIVGFSPPKSSIFIGVFHYKPSILGYPYFRSHPFWKGIFCCKKLKNLTHPTTNMDTQNDGLEKVDSLKIWPFLVSMLDFWGANLFWKKIKKSGVTHTHNIFSTQIRLRPCFTSASMNVDFFEACRKNQKKGQETRNEMQKEAKTWHKQKMLQNGKRDGKRETTKKR